MAIVSSSPEVELLTVQEASELLGVSISTIHRRIAAGELVPTMKLRGDTGAYLIARSDVEALRTERDGKDAA